MLLKDLVELLVLQVLWNFNEEVVGLELVLVVTKELLVEGQGTSLLAIDLEVSHLLAGLSELLGVLDDDHGRVEWLRKISLDLWLLVLLENNLASLLEGVGNLVAANAVLGQVVEVNKLLNVHCLCVSLCNVKVK